MRPALAGTTHHDMGKCMEMMFCVRGLRGFALALMSALALSGCGGARMYVDPTLPMYGANDLPRSAQLRPVQVTFAFQTDGHPNPHVSASLRPRIVAVVAQSRLFSAIVDSSQGGDAAQLSVTINDITTNGNPSRQAMKSGLTFGIAGSMVSDNYVCHATYSWHGKTEQTTVRHALLTALGNQPGPPGLEPKEAVVAIHWVIDQITWNALKQLSDEGAFQ